MAYYQKDNKKREIKGEIFGVQNNKNKKES